MRGTDHYNIILWSVATISIFHPLLRFLSVRLNHLHLCLYNLRCRMGWKWWWWSKTANPFRRYWKKSVKDLVRTTSSSSLNNSRIITTGLESPNTWKPCSCFCNVHYIFSRSKQMKETLLGSISSSTWYIKFMPCSAPRKESENTNPINYLSGKGHRTLWWEMMNQFYSIVLVSTLQIDNQVFCPGVDSFVSDNYSIFFFNLQVIMADRPFCRSPRNRDFQLSEFPMI